MAQSIATPVMRPLQTSRHHVLAAPTMLDDDLLTPSDVATALAQENFHGRTRLFPPHVDAVDFSTPRAQPRWLLSRRPQPPAPLADRQRPAAMFAQYRQLLYSSKPPTGRRGRDVGPPTWPAAVRSNTCCVALERTPRHPLVDDTMVSMADTEAKQAASPQQRAQQPGLGLPSVRAVAVFDLGCGAWTTLGRGPYRGKETGERALCRDQQRYVPRGDVMRADCYDSSYWNLAGLANRGIAYVGRQHHRRSAGTAHWMCGQSQR